MRIVSVIALTAALALPTAAFAAPKKDAPTDAKKPAKHHLLKIAKPGDKPAVTPNPPAPSMPAPGNPTMKTPTK